MERLKIGQSLTPEQVRSLPDGAVVAVTDNFGRGTDLTLALQQNRDHVARSMGAASGWVLATLVSLPTTEPAEPEAEVRSPCLKCGKSLYLNVHALCGEYSGIDYGTDIPPRVASEIEKEAARALVDKRDDALRTIISSPLGDPIHYHCRDYLAAYDYARSIEAIE